MLTRNILLHHRIVLRCVDHQKAPVSLQKALTLFFPVCDFACHNVPQMRSVLRNVFPEREGSQVRAERGSVLRLTSCARLSHGLLGRAGEW